MGQIFSVISSYQKLDSKYGVQKKLQIPKNGKNSNYVQIIEHFPYFHKSIKYEFVLIIRTHKNLANFFVF
jgi:hypothetical protein